MNLTKFSIFEIFISITMSLLYKVQKIEYYENFAKLA
jgi:hypothetical protein